MKKITPPIGFSVFLHQPRCMTLEMTILITNNKLKTF